MCRKSSFNAAFFDILEQKRVAVFMFESKFNIRLFHVHIQTFSIGYGR